VGSYCLYEHVFLLHWGPLLAVCKAKTALLAKGFCFLPLASEVVLSVDVAHHGAVCVSA
jgi:hypothetical protein